MNIYTEVRAERVAQDAQWGGPEHDDEHSPDEFAQFIEAQIDRMRRFHNSRERFVKIAALAIAAIESLDRTTADYGSDDGDGP